MTKIPMWVTVEDAEFLVDYIHAYNFNPLPELTRIADAASASLTRQAEKVMKNAATS